MRKILSLTTSLSLAVLVTAASAQTRLDMSSEYEANSLHGTGDTYFVEKAGELSGGEIEITLHSGGALGLRSPDNLDAVSDGVVAIAGTISGVLAGSEPIFELSSLPFIAPTTEEARTLYDTARPEFERFFESQNQVFL